MPVMDKVKAWIVGVPFLFIFAILISDVVYEYLSS